MICLQVWLASKAWISSIDSTTLRVGEARSGLPEKVHCSGYRVRELDRQTTKQILFLFVRQAMEGRLGGRIKEAAVVEMKLRDANTQSKIYDLSAPTN